MSQTEYPLYHTVIVPTLHHIQAKHGYLKPEEMKRYSKELGIPLHRLHEVASFFPHFRFSKPPKVTIGICRDMACRMAGSAQMIQDLARIRSADIEIEGTSCAGRCDRPPAACFTLASDAPEAAAAEKEKADAAAAAQAAEPFSLKGERNEPAKPEHGGHGGGGHGHAHEMYYLGRNSQELERIAQQCVQGLPPPPDTDEMLPYKAADWYIDPYRGQPSSYAAVLKAVKVRDDSLQRASDLLVEAGWTREKADQFRRSARRRLYIDEKLDQEVLDRVRDWQTNEGLFKGNGIGDWSDTVLSELGPLPGKRDMDLKADLRGLGGAGIPAPGKWTDIRNAIRKARTDRKDSDQGFIVVNGDESEPATFKDRELLLRSPHLIIEGVILAGLISEATQGFIYIRHEYPEQIAACEEEIKRCESLGICGMTAPALGRPFPVAVFPSPGGYICGEQSALIEAMSDRRGEPRNMPPVLETNGLADRPTLVSNVETYAWTPYIWLQGGQTYADLGLAPHRGRRFFSLGGDVVRPGVYEVPMGLPLREFIYGEKYCRGIKDNRKFKAFAPSGPSGGFIPAKIQADHMSDFLKWCRFGPEYPPGVLTLEGEKREKHPMFKTLKGLAERRGFDPQTKELDILELEMELAIWRALCPTLSLGAGLMVYHDGRNMAEEAVNSVEFYRNESCGKCVPCRIGSQKLAILGGNLVAGRIDAARWKGELLPLVRELDEAIIQTSICGLGRSVPLPYRTVMNFFPDDVNRYLQGAGAASGRAGGF